MGTNEAFQKQKINFANGNEASLVTVPLHTSAEQIVAALGFDQPKALILLAGGADKLDDAVKSKVYQLLSRGVAEAAVNANALILDGGTQAGVMQLMGEAIVDCEGKTPLFRRFAFR